MNCKTEINTESILLTYFHPRSCADKPYMKQIKELIINAIPESSPNIHSQSTPKQISTLSAAKSASALFTACYHPCDSSADSDAVSRKVISPCVQVPAGQQVSRKWPHCWAVLLIHHYAGLVCSRSCFLPRRDVAACSKQGIWPWHALQRSTLTWLAKLFLSD